MLQTSAELPMLELQAAVDLDEFWLATKRLLASILPHHSCSLMLGIVDYQPLAGRHHVAVADERGNRPISSLSIAKPFLAAHPRLKLYTYGDILKEDPQVRQRREEREKKFRGWDHFVHLAFWDGDCPDAVLSVRRTEEQGDFSGGERELLASLHPTLDAGLCRLRKLHRERGRAAAMKSYLRRLPMPVVFVEPDGQVAFATQQACELCAIWNHGECRGGALKPRDNFRLPADIARACEHLASQVASTSDTATSMVPTGARLQHPKIAGLFAKIDLAQKMEGPWSQPGFWVTLAMIGGVRVAETNTGSEAAALLQLLSPSEQQVALLVSQGKRNQEIAEQLGKSVRTVEFQLNAIYRKLDLTGRTQLVRALA
jgi:DNA-binding CsgD family transcriptional regulator